MSDVVWRPQAGPQKALVDCPLPEVFFGGARGGGKTDGILGKWVLKALRHGKGFNGIFFRATLPSADDVWERAQDIFCPAGGVANKQDRLIKLPNGARVRFRPLERVQDADKYQGQNVSDVCVEEAGLYATPAPIDRLNGILRSAGGVPTQMILTANPGGAGHGWIKSRYIDPAPQGMQVLSRELPNGALHKFVYIPSRVQENKVLLSSDPGYISRLYLVGSEELVRAWLEGDWSAVEGAFFDCWESQRHVIPRMQPPAHWLKFRSFDWGSAAPFAVHWWAVASDPIRHEGHEIPRGALVCYREWYGAEAPNVGLKMTAEDVARGIVERTKEEITYSVADPSIFAQDGGPSIAERMANAGVVFMRADNARVSRQGHIGGWDQVRQRLLGDEHPMLFFSEICRDTIRTLPVLQHDPNNMEDLDTGAEDHAADSVRYACMSRPWVKPTPAGPADIIKRPTINELWAARERESA